MKFVTVYITCSSQKEAKNISRKLLNAGLVACTNISAIDSLYFWNNKLINDKEFSIIAKTTLHRVREIIKLVKAVHSYKVPCITVLPIITGNKDYLKWVEKETKTKD